MYTAGMNATPETPHVPNPLRPRNRRTFAQKSADYMAEKMGSWAFLITFFIFIIIWVGVNLYAWSAQWDPYPFILLNLTLSCLSAAQAPIILMSQNRQSERDRRVAQYDYTVNRKAEREIRTIQKDLDEIKILLIKIEKDKR